jgi:hypothetical protein
MTQEKETTPCYAKSPTSSRIQTPRSNDVCVYVYMSKIQRLNMEIKLFLLATLGLMGDAFCGMGGGLGTGPW